MDCNFVEGKCENLVLVLGCYEEEVMCLWFELSIVEKLLLDLLDLFDVCVSVEDIKMMVEVVCIIMMFKWLVFDEVCCEGEVCLCCS